MRRFVLPGLILVPLILAACSGEENPPAQETQAGLIGDWQSLSDEKYMLKFDMETYREFYEAEEMSRDQWQPLKSCEDREPIEKTAVAYGGFQIWTKETDSRICYAISDWTAEGVSLTYAGTTSIYKRVN